LIVVTSKKSINKKRRVNKLNTLGAKVLFVKENENGLINLKAALVELAKHQIASILVEGGSEIYTSFLRENLFDDIVLFISPKILGPGLPFVIDFGKSTIKNALKVKIVNVETIDEDLYVELSK